MTKNHENSMSVSEHEEIKEVTPSFDDLQIVMKGGQPVSVILSIEEFDKMTATATIAQELLEGKQFDLADGKKGSFEQLVEERIALERAQYEADLAAMFADEDECDEDEVCEDEEEN